MAGRWPDASRNLLHFLGNSGEQLEQDVDRMLADLPELSDAVALQEATVGSLAVVTGARRAALAPLLLLALPACGGDLEAQCSASGMLGPAPLPAPLSARRAEALDVPPDGPGRVVCNGSLPGDLDVQRDVLALPAGSGLEVRLVTFRMPC